MILSHSLYTSFVREPSGWIVTSIAPVGFPKSYWNAPPSHLIADGEVWLGSLSFLEGCTSHQRQQIWIVALVWVNVQGYSTPKWHTSSFTKTSSATMAASWFGKAYMLRPFGEIIHGNKEVPVPRLWQVEIPLHLLQVVPWGRQHYIVPLVLRSFLAGLFSMDTNHRICTSPWHQ